MRKIFTLLLLLAVGLTGRLSAINQEEARQKASAFLSVRKGRQARSVSGKRTGPSLTLADVNQQDAFFIFNVGNGDGFVIVSASDRTDDILGYSDSGSFDSSKMPDALRAWLDDYHCQIDYLEHHGTSSRENAAPRRASRTSVPMLLKSQWDQGQPFNDSCSQAIGQNTVTGCVPTAMAQLMYYHKYPATVPAIDGYKFRSSSFGEKEMPELPATTFDWSRMYDTYKRGEDGSEVARLMLYCGQAVQVNYGSRASSASAEAALSKLVDVFGYDAGVRSISRSGYYNDEWTQLIYKELAAFRPVLLSGQSASGTAHAFICDGYDSSTDLFHINWGWGGLSDGFFRLSLLNPEDQGAGGSNSSDGYNFSLSAGIGIQPDTGKPAPVNNALTVVSLTLAGSESNTLTRPSDSSNFSILPYLNLMNLSGRSHTYNVGVRLCRGNTVLRTDVWSPEEGVSLENNSSWLRWRTFSFGQGLSDGTYRLEAVYQADDDAEWKLCTQGDENYLELTIEGTMLTVNTVSRKTYQLEVQSVSYAHAEVTQGEPEEVTIAVRNTGGKPYHGEITFLTLKDGEKESWGGSAVDIDPDATATVKIAYTPIRSGTFAARVYQGFFEQGVLLSEDSITIAESKTSVTDADLSFAVSVDNALGSKILGNKAKVKIAITNKSDVLYRGTIYDIVYVWNGSNGKGTAKGSLETVPAQSTIEVERTVEGLEPGVEYSFTAGIAKGSNIVPDRTSIYTYYQTVPAYNIYDATGTLTAIEAIDSIAVDEGVVCVDLRGQNTVKEVMANDNPNVLYLLDSSASVPGGVTGNVVKGTVADSIRLTDGYDFYCPEPFIAKDIRYSRTFATGTDGIGGWGSLVLPFSASRVSVTDGSADGETIDWYHGEDDQDKDFWLRTFEGDKGGELQFADNAENTIDAYAPYIIAVPGDRWGEARNLAGKELVFSARNVVVDKNRSIPQEGDTFRFSGTLQAIERSGFWRLTGDGDKFVRTEGTIMPFRAVLTLMEIGLEASDTLDVPPLSEKVAITPITASPMSATVSSIVRLDGTRVETSTGRLPRGVYIRNGKKVVIK